MLAIVSVSLFGQPPDYERINAVAGLHRIPVIEDAACASGTQRAARAAAHAIAERASSSRSRSGVRWRDLRVSAIAPRYSIADRVDGLRLKFNDPRT
jgi:hypothetical protein